MARIKALLQNRSKLKQNLIQVETIGELEKPKMSARDIEFWDKVNQIMLENLKDVDYNMEQLSEQMHMSRSTFYRKFKGLTGINAAEYLRQLRLQKAATLLSEQGMSVNDVAYEVGFESIAQFRIKFKEMYNINPSSYKKT